LLIVIGTIGGIAASQSDSDSSSSSASISDAMTITDMMGTLSALQSLSKDYDFSRSVIRGYNASTQYIMQQLAQFAPSLQVTQEFFQVPIEEETAPPYLARFGTDPLDYRLGIDYNTMSYSGSSPFDTTLLVANVSFALDPFHLGCDPMDWQNYPFSLIAIAQRGNCSFYQKAMNAETAGASALIVYDNQVEPLPFVTVAPPSGSVQVTIPVFIVTLSVGTSLLALYESPIEIVELGLNASFYYEDVITSNVIATSPGGDASNVVVVGSHLDSVPVGPGINDNGSGSAANLAMAKLFHSLKIKPVNKVVFAWWGAEEIGLLGSTYYVENMRDNNPSQFANLVANLNFDMLGSPNPIRGIYNGSQDPWQNPGSPVIQGLFDEYFQMEKLSTILVDFSGRSDYAAFLENGIPAGGLFSGAEEPKTDQMRNLFGGSLDVALDVCYHEPCDTTDNIDQTVYLQHGQAAAYVLQELFEKKNIRSFLKLPTLLSTDSMKSVKPSSVDKKAKEHEKEKRWGSRGKKHGDRSGSKHHALLWPRI